MVEAVHVAIQRLPVQEPVGPVEPRIMQVVQYQGTKHHVQYVVYSERLGAGVQQAPFVRMQRFADGPHRSLHCYWSCTQHSKAVAQVQVRSMQVPWQQTGTQR